MYESLKRAMHRLTPQEVALRELADAELSLLQAESASDYAQSVVSYNKQRIARLRGFLVLSGLKKC